MFAVTRLSKEYKAFKKDPENWVNQNPNSQLFRRIHRRAELNGSAAFGLVVAETALLPLIASNQALTNFTPEIYGTLFGLTALFLAQGVRRMYQYDH